MSIGVSLLLIACIVIIAILLIKTTIPGGRGIQLPIEIGITLLGITFAFNVVSVKVKQSFSIANYMPTGIQGWLGIREGQDLPASPVAKTTTSLFLSPEAEKQESSVADNDHRSTDSSKATTAVARSHRAPRFLAIRTGRKGGKIQVRLYDSRERIWLDNENHALEREPKEGSMVQVGGVTAAYVRKRPSQ